MPKRSADYVQGLVEDLKDPVMAVHYLNAALEESNAVFLLALRDVAESYRVAKVAEGAGRSRESLYRTLSETGNPRLNTLTGILNTLGLKLSIQPIAASGSVNSEMIAQISKSAQPDPATEPQIAASHIIPYPQTVGGVGNLVMLTPAANSPSAGLNFRNRMEDSAGLSNVKRAAMQSLKTGIEVKVPEPSQYLRRQTPTRPY